MQSRGEAILRAIIDGGSASDLPAPQSRVEALLLELLESGAAGSLAIHVCTVDEYDAETGVPTVQDPDEKTIYLVPGDNETGSDLYIEWIYVDSNWEQFGSATIDLSDYALKSDLTGVVYNNSYASTSTGGVVKYNTSKGISVDNAGILTIYPAESGTIKSGSDAYKPIVPATQHEAAFYGLAEVAGDLTQISSQNAVGVYTDNAKLAIRQMIGSVGQDMIAADYASLSFPVSKGDHCIHGGKLYEAAQDIATTEAWTAAHWTEIVLGYEVADLKSAITPADYSVTATYAVGDLCWHEGKMYRCSTAIDTAEAWTAAHWTEIVIPKDVRVNGVSVVTSGVANVPVASTNNLGVVKLNRNSGGIEIDGTDGYLRIYPPTVEIVKAGTSTARPLNPNLQNASTFYGLAKAAGADMKDISSTTVGVYPEAQKSAISSMLHAPETVSGSTPSITGKAGVRYICGEVSTLSITAPASGCIDVVFESGSTPTVLTLASAKSGVTAIKWAGGFDPTSLDASTTYELNILDGEYGVAAAWT